METYFVMIGIFVVFLAISAVIGLRDRKRLDARERKKLKENFGQPGAKEYPDGRYEQIPGYCMRHRQDFEVDDITWNDLDMDLLYRRMDTTCCAAGEEYLYWLLRSPRTDGGTYLSEEGMQWWTANEQIRLDVQRILQGLGRASRYSVYDYLDLLDSLEDRGIAADLPALVLPAVSLGIMFVSPPVGLCCLLGSFALNMITYFRAKRAIEPYLFTFRYVLRLLECARVLLAKRFPFYDSERAKMEKARKAMAGFSMGSGLLMRNNGGITSGSFADIILDYICILFHIDLLKFGSMLRALRGKEEEIDGLITSIGAIDAQISLASWRESLPLYCIPDLTGSRFEAVDLIHPLLTDPVPNSISVSKPVLLTGSNASGKN